PRSNSLIQTMTGPIAQPMTGPDTRTLTRAFTHSITHTLTYMSQTLSICARRSRARGKICRAYDLCRFGLACLLPRAGIWATAGQRVGPIFGVLLRYRPVAVVALCSRIGAWAQRRYPRPTAERFVHIREVSMGRWLLCWLAAVGLVGLSSGPLKAWHERGHMVVTLIAYRQLDDGQKKRIQDILKEHPHYQEFLTAQRPPDAPVDEWVVMQASVWP